MEEGVVKKKRYILTGIGCECRSGEVLAMYVAVFLHAIKENAYKYGSLGGSGSGKTTLLNAIAHRLGGLPIASGEVIFCSEIGGPSLSRKHVKKRIGFVRQQDYLVDCLTGIHISERQ